MHIQLILQRYLITSPWFCLKNFRCKTLPKTVHWYSYWLIHPSISFLPLIQQSQQPRFFLKQSKMFKSRQRWDWGGRSVSKLSLKFVNLPHHLSSTCQQNPNFLRLGSSKATQANWGANCHSCHFEPAQCKLEVISQRSKLDHTVGKTQRLLTPLKPAPSILAVPRNCLHN